MKAVNEKLEKVVTKAFFLQLQYLITFTNNKFVLSMWNR